MKVIRVKSRLAEPKRVYTYLDEIKQRTMFSVPEFHRLVQFHDCPGEYFWGAPKCGVGNGCAWVEKHMRDPDLRRMACESCWDAPYQGEDYIDGLYE